MLSLVQNSRIKAANAAAAQSAQPRVGSGDGGVVLNSPMNSPLLAAARQGRYVSNGHIVQTRTTGGTAHRNGTGQVQRVPSLHGRPLPPPTAEIQPVDLNAESSSVTNFFTPGLRISSTG
jgi:hypothetical protein